jgi:V/A-type H+-transporting ATPase subunit E
MAQTIESFVTQLQQEGVQAGRQQADQIRADAEKQAAETIAQAKAQADQIRADAEKQAAETIERGRTELDLAARDTIQRLRMGLENALSELLSLKVTDALEDPDFLTSVLHELVMAYAKADVNRDDTILINVSQKLHGKVADWAIQELAAQARQARTQIDLKGNLRQAGFEYTFAGGTVEVTNDALVNVLAGMVTPRLREMVERAARPQE